MRIGSGFGTYLALGRGMWEDSERSGHFLELSEAHNPRLVEGLGFRAWGSGFRAQGLGRRVLGFRGKPRGSPSTRSGGTPAPSEREIFIENLLVRVHLIIEMSRPALHHGSLNSLCQVALYLPSYSTFITAKELIHCFRFNETCDIIGSHYQQKSICIETPSSPHRRGHAI